MHDTSSPHVVGDNQCSPHLTKARLQRELHALQSNQSVCDIFIEENNLWRVNLNPVKQDGHSVNGGSVRYSFAPDLLELSPSKKNSCFVSEHRVCPSDAAFCESLYESFEYRGAAYPEDATDKNLSISASYDDMISVQTTPTRQRIRRNFSSKSVAVTFTMRFPQNYPFSPPVVHVNDSDGMVFPTCDLLHWTPACTVSDVVRAVQQLVKSV